MNESWQIKTLAAAACVPAPTAYRGSDRRPGTPGKRN